MQIKALLAALAGAAMVVDAADVRRSPIHAAMERRQNRGGGNGNNNQGGQGVNGLALTQNVLQRGSANDGNNPGSKEQAASATSNNNFINFCQGKTLTNGAQVRAGSCNGIPMGNIPATTKMVSSIFINPQNGDNIAAKKDFDIQVQMLNFAPGAFTNATNTYYSAPQDLNQEGVIIGHTHVTVQDTGKTLNPQQPLDPQKFAFFKGINDAGNGRGLLSAKVTGGLPAGNYRLCSMSSSANHQPVLMPVAQRGAQDDCVRFTVGGQAGGNNNGKGGVNNQNGQQQGGQQGGQQQGGQQRGGQQQGQDGQKQGQAGQQQGQDGQKGSLRNNGQVASGGSGGTGAGKGGASKSSALGGIGAPDISQTQDKNRPFGVSGNSFTTKGEAVQRSCETQRAACQNGVQSGAVKNVELPACDTQMAQCISDLS